MSLFKHIALAFIAVAALTVGCGTSSTVNQSPTPIKCQVTLASVPSMDPSGGTGVLAVTTQPECAWDASTSATWISSLQPASGQGTAEVSFRVAANEGAGTRDGAIIVNGETARVSQRAPCRYDLTPASQTVGVGGGSGSISVATANECTWTATADAGWIALGASASGTGSGRVAFTLSPNQGDSRSGAIVVGNQRAVVTQSGVSAPAPAPPGCTTAISPTSHRVDALGGPGIAVTVSAGATCQWTATSNASWITITTGATATGAASVTFSVAANTGIERTGTLTIAGRTFTVTQSAAGTPPAPPSTSCSYAITPQSANPPASATSTTVQVTTAAGCAWTTSSSVAWITIASGASGTGSGSVNASIAANTGGARSGVLTIAGQTFTVTQAAATQACSYSVAPTNQRVGPNNGSGTFTVATGSGCPWTARSNASWITVTGGASGTGAGTVTFSVVPNTSGDRRTGTLTVAGQNVTVEQNGRGNDD